MKVGLVVSTIRQKYGGGDNVYLKKCLQPCSVFVCHLAILIKLHQTIANHVGKSELSTIPLLLIGSAKYYLL